MILFVLFLISLCNAECTARRRRGALDQFKETRYRNAQVRRETYLTNETIAAVLADEPRTLWYMVQPDYSCEDTALIGNRYRDGAKYVCNLHWLMTNTKDCVYYTFGVNGEIGFEEEFVILVPDCEMHAFDPTPSVIDGPSAKRLVELGIEYHAIGLSDFNGDITLEKKPVPVRTLDFVRHMLGHAEEPITVLKIDIESHEWLVFKHQLATCDRNQPMAYQILVEFHYLPWATGIDDKRIDLMFERLRDCGYRCFMKDPNHHCQYCIEYGFVHEKFLHCQS